MFVEFDIIHHYSSVEENSEASIYVQFYTKNNFEHYVNYNNNIRHL